MIYVYGPAGDVAHWRQELAGTLPVAGVGGGAGVAGGGAGAVYGEAESVIVIFMQYIGLLVIRM